MHSNVHIHDAEMPSMAGSKFNVWQTGQNSKGDPRRGNHELPSSDFVF